MILFAALNQRDDDWTELYEDIINARILRCIIPTDVFFDPDREIYDALKRGETVELEIKQVK